MPQARLQNLLVFIVLTSPPHRSAVLVSGSAGL